MGLSGLLVKSAQQMVSTAEDFQNAGIQVPLLVGGAALSEKFATTKIAPAYGAPTFYAKDAMTGLRLLNEIMDPAHARGAAAESRFRRTGSRLHRSGRRQSMTPGDQRSSKVRTRYPHPADPLQGSPGPARAELTRGLELYQPLHAVRPPSWIQG